VQVAELLGAGVAKALLGKMVLPDDLPFVTGSIGVIGTQASFQMMNGCDTLLMVGSSFPYSEFLPPEGKARPEHAAATAPHHALTGRTYFKAIEVGDAEADAVRRALELRGAD
jgi:thiamine pyrophosphate-dependent acetolactate synthase large subunit-like protein